ncbi:MAG TPA: polysaccharide deacetylase family protein [Rubrobacter sp.]|nr:polysaccharide deacetylase family protein [Rubrobacter sp.]
MAGRIALTFDDGPDPVWTPRVLDALAEAGARATFFVVAPLAARRPGLLRRAAAEGHEVALHCNRHERHDRMDAGEIVADAEEGLRTLGALGHEVRGWRVPWGVVTRDTEDVAAGLGLRLVGWTADSEDWRGEDADRMLGRLAPGIEEGAVVLMHDGVGPGSLRDGCGLTVDLVAPLVSLAASRGLTPAPVGRMPAPLPARNPGKVAGV